MKSTYKIALLAAAGILLIVIIYFAAQGNRKPHPELAEVGSGHGAGVETKTPAEGADDFASHDAASPLSWANRHHAAPSAQPPAGSSLAQSGTAGEARPSNQANNPNQSEQASDRAAFLADLKATAAAIRGESTTTREATSDSNAAVETGHGRPTGGTLAAGSQETAEAEGTSAMARANQTLSVSDDRSPARTDTDTGTNGESTGSSANTTGTTRPGQTTSASPSRAAASSAAATGTRASNAASQASAAAGHGGTYTIQEGDTFVSIAKRLYHDEHRWVDISQANPLVDPTRLHIGQKIRLPGPGQTHKPAATTPAPPSRAPRPATTAHKPEVHANGRGTLYTIEAGDTLWTIARKYYHDPAQWRTIFEANRRTLGNDPNHIKAGQALVIPPAATGDRER